MPLSRQAIDLLAKLKEHARGDFIFPGRGSALISRNAVWGTCSQTTGVSPRTLPVGNVGVERSPTETGERQIWLEPLVVDKLRHLRGPGQSFGDVILRLAASQ